MGIDRDLDRAADVIAAADAVVVTAGAGMGIDAGLPDFRGDEGFWRAYPPYRGLGYSFVEMASPQAFRTDPTLAWGFYGHRRALYRRTRPHEGHHVLRGLLADAPLGGTAVTSNVDGLLQRADVGDETWEVHGTIHIDQCLGVCGHPPFAAGPDLEIDATTMRAVPPLPTCPGCGGPARPNILMFGDAGWDGTGSDAQARRFESFLHDVHGERLVVVECGAGTALPTIRRIGEQVVRELGAALVRINPQESHGPAGTIGLPLGAADALTGIAGRLA